MDCEKILNTKEEEEKTGFSNAELLLYNLMLELPYVAGKFFTEKDKLDSSDYSTHFVIKQQLFNKQFISKFDLNEILRQLKLNVDNGVINYILKNLKPESNILKEEEITKFKQKHLSDETLILTNKDYKQIPKKQTILLCKKHILIMLMFAEHSIDKGYLNFDIKLDFELGYLESYDGAKLYFNESK